MSKDETLQREIRTYLDGLRMIDTHEHLDAEQEFCSQPVDFGRLFLHYANCDLVSAGCPARDIELLQNDRSLSPQKKWLLIEPYWDFMRGTGYGRCIELAIRDLHGQGELSSRTVDALTESMTACRRPGFYRQIFDRAGIAVALWNRLDRFGPIPRMWTPEYDRGLFCQDMVSPYLHINEPGWQNRWGKEILCLDDYLGAIEEHFVGYASQAAALKIDLAYTRPIDFPNRSRSEIEPIFNCLLDAGWERNASMPNRKELMAIQDYLVHFSLQQCSKYDLAVKFHTGLQEGNGNVIANSRAALLANLFFKYPQVRFDIYHVSYPYQEELATLAKNFPNVSVDFCWMWIINPTAGRRALSDLLDAVPANKIHGFGGDFIFIEGSYAHALMAKENIASVLAEKVSSGNMIASRALSVGKWLLRDNPIRWFRLQEKVPAEVLGKI